jgi:hypothetical protein
MQPAERREPGPDERDFWSLFGAVYCISLPSRPDRRRAVALRFAEAGLAERVVFWEAVARAEDPARGCWESHASLMRHAAERGIDRLLVFEDDVLFTRLPGLEETRSVAALLDRADWNVLHLGCKPYHLRASPLPLLYRCHALDSHAYVLSLDFMRRAQRARYAKLLFPHCIDCLFLVSRGTWALAPMLCTQDDSVSDIERRSPGPDDRPRREAACLRGGLTWQNLELKARLLALAPWNHLAIRLRNPRLDLGLRRTAAGRRAFGIDAGA